MGQLHIVLLPLIAHGHMIPILDMAKLLASRGIKATIIATHAFSDPIKQAQSSGHDIGLSLIKFPPEGSDLPDDMVSLDQMKSEELIPKFLKAFELLQEPVEKLLEQLHPNALVSDMFLPWTVDSAAKLGIPRLVFHGTSYFALCCSEQMRRNKPYKGLSLDSEEFVIPNLPHKITLVRSQVSPFELAESGSLFTKLLERMWEANWRSYGTVFNSFYELEPDYADHYRNVLGRKAWSIGPLLLSDKGKGSEKKALRGKKSAIDTHECLAWLNSKKPHSVVYMCFGSIASFTPSQMRETAIGLEASGQNFIWVVRRNKDENEDWLPEGFEERTKGKGLIIRGWAPQVMILEHKAIGAFVTHCGWNSTLEGVCAGVPMVTWPVFAEQFYNEKLVTQVLKTGVSVGSKKWERVMSEGISSESLAKAVEDVMVGKESEEMRKRAENNKEMARKAIEEGGSSYNSLNDMVEELSAYRNPTKGKDTQIVTPSVPLYLSS